MNLQKNKPEVHSSLRSHPRRWMCRRIKRIPTLWLLVVGLVSQCPTSVQAESAIAFGGVPVDLKISEIDEQTVRIELRPLDQNSNSAVPSWTLAEFSAKERFHSHELVSEKKLRVGALRLTIQPRPLSI